MENALQRVREERGWSEPALHEIVELLRARERLGWIELEHLEKFDRRTGLRFRVIYEVTERGSALHVLVADSAGVELRRERVAFAEPWRPLEIFFPVRSAVLKNGVYTLRDRDRQPLAALIATDDVEGAAARTVR
jgi:hypothetical protein